MNNWKELFALKKKSADDAVILGISSGDYLVVGHAASTPGDIIEAIYKQRESFSDLKVFHMLYFGEPWHLKEEMQSCIKPYINFLDGNSRKPYREGRVEYLPCHFHELPKLFEGDYPVDVAIVQVSYPNEDGLCSFGITNDYCKAATKHAKKVIVEMNKQMPFIGGDNFIHVSEIDYIVEVDKDLLAFPPAKIGERELTIAQHCAKLVKDGDTLQLGIGAIPDAVLHCLKDRKDLGIHTEMFTDGVMHMLKSGTITGAKKTLLPNKVVTTLAMGSADLYQFLNNNNDVVCYPVDFTNDPYVIGQNDNLVSINSCIEMDLTGQAASEAVGQMQFSGTGGQVDFLRGAKRSKGGRAILAFPSTAKDDTISRIVPVLSEGSTITAGRNEIDYVATEYGIVRLHGLSLKERAIALCSIAHPKFRPMLEEAIKERFH